MGGHIDPPAFYSAAGILFGLAIGTAIARTCIRLYHFRKLSIDDGFLFLAVATLISGTTLLFINVPESYTQQQVVAGLEEIPLDFLETLASDQRTQEAGTVLTSTTIVSVKYAFLFFFRRLLSRTNKRYLKWWWWATLIITTGCAPVFIFSDFIACPYTGDMIMEKCIGSHAISRQNAILQTTVVMDIITDVFIISIPALIIYPIQLSLHKKVTLTTILCLSILMIVFAIVRISMATTTEDKQINTLWIILWLELEACVAVMTVSVSAFSILFTSDRNSLRTGGQGQQQHHQQWTNRTFPSRDPSVTAGTATAATSNGVSSGSTLIQAPSPPPAMVQKVPYYNKRSICKTPLALRGDEDEEIEAEREAERRTYQLPPIRISLGLEMGMYFDLNSDFKSAWLSSTEPKEEPITPVTPVAVLKR